MRNALLRFETRPWNDGFGAFQNMFSDMERLLTRPRPFLEENIEATNQFATLSADVHEDDTSYEIQVDLPGVSNSDIELHFEKGILSLKGKRESLKEFNDSAKEDKRKFLRQERFMGSFERNFRLPENADGEQTSAEFKEGVLKISIPKREPTKTKNIEIKVK